MILKDVSAERAVLGGICTYGSDAYFDIADIISERTFTDETNATIFRCLKLLLDADSDVKVDIPLIYSAANTLEMGYIFKKAEETKHLQSIMKMPVLLPNVRKFAATIRKLEIARLLYDQLEGAQDKLLEVKGHENVTEIIGLAENTIFDFTSLLNTTQDEEPSLLVDGLTAHIEYLMNNPVAQIGISSGYPIYDTAIGGGFRRGSVSMIGARTKAGKSILAMNVGTHVSRVLKIPVLYLDTEMVKDEQQIRFTARITETPIDDLETGKCGKDMFSRKRILNSLKQVEELKIPLSYKNVSGQSFEDILSIMRRWVMKVVGVNDDGKAKDCLIIYDYMKLMSADGLGHDMKEYQLLGFMMTSLHNFSVRYSLPVLSFIQLNRDGINKESTDAAAGSDRIMWLCSNFAIYKFKTDDDIAKDGLESGNRKLVPIISRHGPGLDNGDYINMVMTGKFAKIVEGKTAFEKHKEEGFITEDDNDDEIPFSG